MRPESSHSLLSADRTRHLPAPTSHRRFAHRSALPLLCTMIATLASAMVAIALVAVTDPMLTLAAVVGY